MFRLLSPRAKCVVSAHQQWNALSQIGDLIKPQSTNRKDFIQECKSGKLDGVVAAYRTFASISITGFIDEELVNALPDSWRYLAHNGKSTFIPTLPRMLCLGSPQFLSEHSRIRACIDLLSTGILVFVCTSAPQFDNTVSHRCTGAGYDQIVPDACSKRNPPLLVSNTPVVPDDATADTAIFLMLGTLRNFNTSMTALRRGHFKGRPAPALGHDPQGKTLGILGMGGIGRNIKRKADVFGMNTIYHNRRELSPEMAGGAKYVSFDDLLKASDVLSLNVPLNAKTRHIISTEQLKLMKPSAIVVNTARGPVVDEAALVDALGRGLIAGAGLDVYEEEPKVHPALVENDNVMLLPHMGTWTSETQEKMECWAIDNIRSAVTGKGLMSLINEQQALGLDKQT